MLEGIGSGRKGSCGTEPAIQLVGPRCGEVISEVWCTVCMLSQHFSLTEHYVMTPIL